MSCKPEGYCLNLPGLREMSSFIFMALALTFKLISLKRPSLKDFKVTGGVCMCVYTLKRQSSRVPSVSSALLASTKSPYACQAPEEFTSL